MYWQTWLQTTWLLSLGAIIFKCELSRFFRNMRACFPDGIDIDSVFYYIYCQFETIDALAFFKDISASMYTGCFIVLFSNDYNWYRII